MTLRFGSVRKTTLVVSRLPGSATTARLSKPAAAVNPERPGRAGAEEGRARGPGAAGDTGGLRGPTEDTHEGQLAPLHRPELGEILLQLLCGKNGRMVTRLCAIRDGAAAAPSAGGGRGGSESARTHCSTPSREPRPRRCRRPAGNAELPYAPPPSCELWRSPAPPRLGSARAVRPRRRNQNGGGGGGAGPGGRGGRFPPALSLLPAARRGGPAGGGGFLRAGGAGNGAPSPPSV